MRELSHILEDVSPQLQLLEKDRLFYLKQHRRYTMVVAVPLLAILIGGFLLKAIFITAGVAFGWLVISGILYYLNAGKLGGAYRDKFKTSVLPRLIEAVDPNLQYDAKRGISSSSFVDTELYTTRPDRYRTEDLIYGTYGNTKLQLAEIRAQEERSRQDSDGNNETYYVTIFEGILLIADFHKHFHGRTFIFPDKAEKLFGNFGRFLQKMGGRSKTDLIRMEDPEFEKAFAVYSTDEIEARYILSTAMMRRILNIRSRFGENIRVSFKDSCLILAVPHRKPFLEPDRKVAATDSSQIQELLLSLSHFLDTIEELDLNTRIWTKQ